MSTLVILATSDTALADTWERQLPAGRVSLRLERQGLPSGTSAGLAAVVILDANWEPTLSPSLARCPTIVVGEPRSLPFEQAKMSKRGRVFLSYEESETRLREFLPLLEEVAEKQSMLDMASERNRRTESARSTVRASTGDPSELWDFLEGAIENLDTRERLIGEFRRASRQLLRASHAVFFLREGDGFRADRGTSYFPPDDPMVAYFENHPMVIDGMNWEGPDDPAAELAVRNRLAMWGARLLVPVHENGRLLGLIALGVRDDGQCYDQADRSRVVFFARLLRQFLSRCSQITRLIHVSNEVALGAKYLPATLVLGPDENAPRHVPLVVRDLIGQARKAREVVRAAPSAAQPFRASAGIIAETGGVWAFWEEASSEVHDAIVREREGRRELLRELALTLSHELGNALVSLTVFRQAGDHRPVPPPIVETMKGDVAQLEALNDNLALMQNLHAVEPSVIDIRDLTQSVGKLLGVRVEIGPDPVMLTGSRTLLEFALRSLVRTVGENRSEESLSDLSLKVRSTGSGASLTALISLRGKDLELEGILPEPVVDAVPNQGRLGVFLAKEILRLHHGEIHAGPGMECVEILISLQNL